MTFNNREAFNRIADYRVNRVLKDLELLGNAACNGIYEYDDDDIETIMNRLESGLNTLKNKLISKKH